MPGVLFSTNTFLKLIICERYRKDIHYVWCSECFDASKRAAYSASAIVAPSSDPSTIYKQLKDDVRRSDKHSAKINEQKLSFSSLAATWAAAGEISPTDAAEICYMVENASFDHWRPLLYVIPRDPVAVRVQLVPPAKRASIGTEFIIPDLARTEFEIVEV